MKKLIFTWIAAGMCSFYAGAQDVDQAAAMKAMQEYSTPGPIHAMMAKAAGNWTHETILLWDPANPTTSKGTGTVKMILGGRYQQSEYKSIMMGQPFQGMNILGYDNKAQIFTTTWIDNMGTGTMTLTGKWDDATKSVTFTGTAIDPMSGQPMPVREVVSWPDEDHEHMELYQTMNGTEMKVMVMKSERVKTARKK